MLFFADANYVYNEQFQQCHIWRRRSLLLALPPTASLFKCLSVSEEKVKHLGNAITVGRIDQTTKLFTDQTEFDLKTPLSALFCYKWNFQALMIFDEMTHRNWNFPQISTNITIQGKQNGNFNTLTIYSWHHFTYF